MVKITRNKHKQLRQQRRKTKKQYGGTLEEEYGNEARERINNIIAIQDYMTSGQAEEKAEYETKMRELKQYHVDLIEFLEQNGNKSLLDTPIETQVIINTKPTKVRTIIFYLILYYVADMELVIKCIRKLYEKRANLNIKNWLGQTAMFGEVSGHVMGYTRSVFLPVLLECGVDPNAESNYVLDGQVVHITPLNYLTLSTNMDPWFVYHFKNDKSAIDQMLLNKRYILFFLEHKDQVDINKPTILFDGLPSTPLSIIVKNNPSKESLSILIDGGIDPNIPIEFIENGQKIVIPAITETLRGVQVRLTEVLLTAPTLDVNAECVLNDESFTPLRMAMRAFLNITRKYNESIRAHAMKSSKENINKFMENKNVYEAYKKFILILVNHPKINLHYLPSKTNPMAKARTALMESILLGEPEIAASIIYLSDATGLNTRDEDGKSALEYAYEKGAPDVFQLILRVPGIDTMFHAKMNKGARKEQEAMSALLQTYKQGEMSNAAANADKAAEELLQMEEEATAKKEKRSPIKKSIPKKVVKAPEPKKVVQAPTPAPEPKKVVQVPEPKPVLDTSIQEREQEREAKIKVKMAEKAAKKESMRSTIAREIESLDSPFWVDIFGGNEKALYAIKRSFQEKIIANPDPCAMSRDILFSMQFNRVRDPQLQMNICASLLLYGIIAKLLQDTCAIYLKGGKAIQANITGEYKSDDIDIIVVDPNGDREKQQQIAIEIGKIIRWITTPPSPLDFVDIPREEGAIVKVAPANSPRTSILDIGYGVLPKYILDQYETDPIHREFSVDGLEGALLIPNATSLLREHLYYLIKYHTLEKKEAAQAYFLKKTHRSINALLDELVPDSEPDSMQKKRDLLSGLVIEITTSAGGDFFKALPIKFSPGRYTPETIPLGSPEKAQKMEELVTYLLTPIESTLFKPVNI